MRLTAAQALVRFLAVQESERDGVRRPAVPAMLGIFGHGNVCGIGQALAEPGAMRFQQTKHEQAMVHTAIGFAKASRRLATLACTASIGPGATNLVTGAATATTNRLPVLLLPGDTFASRLQGPVLQQLQHPSHGDWSVNEALRPVSRYYDRISRPEQLLEALPEAMRVLLDPAETGAVTIALHQDVQGEAYGFPDAFFAARTWRVARRPPERWAIEALAELLRGAERPLAIAGGGVCYSEAEDALAALSLPVAETSAGKGAGGEATLGGIGVNGTIAANEAAAAADVVLCVGTRLSDFTTASRSLFGADTRFAAVNVCAADAHRMGALPVVADAREALVAVRRALGDRRAPRAHAPAWTDPDLGPFAAGRALQAINRSSRAGDWVVAAAGSPPGDLLKLWRCPPGSRAHIEFAFSCMGHEIPAGIGIRMAEPEAGEILVVIGDGTYLMAPTELVTAVQERLKVTAVVLVNGGYRSIESLQRAALGIRFGNAFATDVDVAANAASMGCATWDVDSETGLEAALEEARGQELPAVIACRVDPDRGVPGSGAWWDLGVPEVAADPAIAAAAAAHARGATGRRWHG